MKSTVVLAVAIDFVLATAMAFGAHIMLALHVVAPPLQEGPS